MFQSSPFLSLHLWHLQVQLCHNHTSLLVNKYYVWSWGFHLSITLCIVIPKQLGIISLDHFFSQFVVIALALRFQYMFS